MLRAVRKILLAALVAAPGAAAADPLALTDSAAIDRFASLVESYADASRVRWVVVAPDAEVRSRALRDLVDRLGPDKADLAERVRGEVAVASARAIAPVSTGAVQTEPARAYIEIAEASGTPCSWRVTVSDPAAPSPGAMPVAIPLDRSERLPVSSAATYEIGFSGPLQSTLYAFAETAPGAVRDLAAAPEIAIPVAGAEPETLVLVRARRPIPFLDGIRIALADQPGARRALGSGAALAERFESVSRGIGALIQLVDPTMVVAEATLAPPVQPKSTKTPEAEFVPAGENEPVAAAEDLIETCMYTIDPLTP